MKAEKATGSLNQSDKTKIRMLLEKAADDCKSCDMRCTLLQIERMQNGLKASIVTHADLAISLGELLRRLSDEAKLSRCLVMSQDEADLYTSAQPFGPEIEDRFPAAVNDISEAARCLACGRGTATVFHLMRVMEVGLKEVAQILEIPNAPSWESYLTQIQTRIDAKYKAKGIQWKKHERIFRDVAAHLYAVKVAWRNPTMHIVNHYSPEQAEAIFNSVKGFMRSLSTEIQ
jgi:hypothetical protein